MDAFDFLNRHKVLIATLAAASIFFIFGEVGLPFYAVFRTGPYLVIRGVTEGLSVLFCVLAFAVTWHSFFQSRNHQDLFLGMSFFAVGAIDLFHVLSYAGMPDFITTNTVNKAAQFWIAGRLIATVSFFTCAFIRPDSKNTFIRPFPLLVAAALLVWTAFFSITFFSGYLPVMSVPWAGPTQLKVDIEYGMAAMNIATIVLFNRWYRKTAQEHYVYFISALILYIYSGLLITLHAGAFDTYRIMGHVYKFAAYYLIYQALFTTSVKKPYRELSKAEARLRSYMYTLEDKVRERTRTLAEKNEELTKLNRLKTELLAVCSHDMKSPLQGSQLMLELLLMESDGPLTNDQKKTIEAIQKNEEELIGLITNLLDLARREEGAMKLGLAPVDIRRLVKPWHANQALVAGKMGISFELDMKLAPEDAVIKADEFKLRQVLGNLMSNALKFTPKGGLIRLAVSRDGSQGPMRFSMFNTGPAIPGDKLTTIFGKYVQADRNGPGQGAGLGLNISKTIVELHGGSIWAESMEGVGSTFYFTLPPQPPEPGGRSACRDNDEARGTYVNNGA